MTLVEVLLAAAILGLGLATLLGSLGHGLAMMRSATEYQEAQWALGLGELLHPMVEAREPEELEVTPVSDFAEGYTFERTVDPKEESSDIEDDGLYTVRTRLWWGDGSGGRSEELVSLIWLKDAGK